ncbi:serine/threonine-protein kinase [Actinomadura flavalba]|uniref:serine/threonine-protein kinase n=1 Tax=Actinomadura flavalba TaxID=1120938 RepID=UPI00036A1607|nr:serine/threonine-protein kinase [Actinomadura flavalba]
MTSHVSPTEALRPGDPRELGPYRLLSRLGQGGMGTVYLGQDERGRRVAVKVINRELAGEAPFRERFRREVTAARQVRRFCTAPVLDAELERDPLFVVTEFIDGPSLEKAVAERGPLPGSELEGLAVGVATALAAIHGAGIVHRDLKPANVLLSSTGPRVIDFGIARALDAAPGDGPTRTGHFVGTPSYLPPELLRGEPITPASDVFSWGCVIAYAGTGAAPFAGATMPEIFYRVAHETPDLSRLDPAVRDVVAAALDKDPRRRPTVDELLGRLVGTARPDPARLADTVQRTWSPPPQPTRPEAPPPPPPPSRRGGVPVRALAAGAAVLAVVVLVGVGLVGLFGGGPPDDTQIVFSDDFADTRSGWPGSAFTGGRGYFENQYRADLRDSQNVEMSESPFRVREQKLPARQLVSATVTFGDGPANGQAGLFCRGTDAGTRTAGYQFLLRKDGAAAVIRKAVPGGGAVELARSDKPSGYDEGEPNRVQVACEEDDGAVRLRMWIDGEEAASATDRDRPLGDANSGLVVARAGQASAPSTALFDDFDISEIRN